MTKRHRSFGVKKRQEADPDNDITFDLENEETGFKRTFTCKPDIQGAIILDFVAAAEDGSGTAAAAKIMSFFKDALPADEHKKFLETIHGDDVLVEMDTLSDIVAYLIEEYTSRPTPESE